MPRNLIESDIRDFSGEQEMTTTEQQWADPGELETYISLGREMVRLKENKTRLEEREAELKKTLMDILDRLGQPYGSEGQHKAITFPTPIRGVLRFVRQVKVSTGVDESKAEAIARSRGIYDRLFKPVMTLDESAVMVAREEGLLTDTDLESMFPKKRVHSFVMERKK